MSVTNMAVLTGLQFPLTGVVTSLVTGGTARRLSPSEMIGTSFIGGLISGIACAPMELVMIQQQRFGGTIYGTPMRLIESYGLSSLGRGLTTSCGREGLFTAGYLGCAPTVTRTLTEDYGLTNANSRVVGAIVAGLIFATLSHPLDTLKTCMQGDMERTTYKTVTHTTTTLYKDSSFTRFFRGWGFRSGRMILGIFILNMGKSIFGPLLFPHHFEK
eukprot:TRINITY_DN1555_c0_g1_i14.p1 TRINITY_DN1555_c0_g1~~TRINITY_DN1555_c0_g1_i14.p1  ORF type:complete len:216 (-),score=25.48 TRINITY_DN1555_c0_g1_i14:57-704(-)